MIGIILASGKSNRFNQSIPKQLYPINNKPIIDYSIEALSILDDVIVVTNSECYNQINFDSKLLLDTESRLDTIKGVIKYLGNKSIDNIIIHDAARPFITTQHIQTLVDYSKESKHCQYYLKLVNGLAKRRGAGWEVADREDYIELTSPQITDWDLFKHIFSKWIMTGLECEILPVMSKLDLEPKLIEGFPKDLRKITTLFDIY
jgi:2-C-methyl-D-erythritol 4-phosphate cytidylyltransferase/2-C-methyl-D-erythritol 2,4-cyclodiphosphate synthase